MGGTRLGKPGTGTCEEIDSSNFSGGPKCIPEAQPSFVGLLNHKFLNADSLEIWNLHFFTRSRRDVSRQLAWSLAAFFQQQPRVKWNLGKSQCQPKRSR